MSADYCNQWLSSWSVVDRPRHGFGFDDFVKVVVAQGWHRNLANKVVLVAGTNGKGSCVKAIEALAIQDNQQVFSFTSPHISELTERFVLNGESIGYDLLAKHLVKIIALESIYYKFSFFETLTLVCFSLVKELKIDLLILEVGLGGRFDCTNATEHDCAVITSIGYDHQNILGDTLSEIAYQKAGVIRNKVPVVCGMSAVEATIRNIACEKNAKLIFAKVQDFKNFSLQNSSLHAAKLCFIELFGDRDYLDNTLSSLSLAGRFEVVKIENKTVIFDVAHNVPAIKSLVKRLKQNGYNKVDVVCNFAKDKDYSACIDELSCIVNNWYFFILDGSRLLAVDALFEVIDAKNIKNFKIINSIKEVRSSILLVCGSFVVVSEARKLCN